jgi:hypothetical protein
MKRDRLPSQARTVLVLALVSVLVLAACATSATPGPASASPAGRPSSAPSASAAPATPVLSPTETTPTPTTTPPAPTPVEPSASAEMTPTPDAAVIETAWGKAWDRIPIGFPLPADAQVADPGDPTEGASSAVYVSSQERDAIVRLVTTGMATLGFSVEGIGEAEDGSAGISLVGKPASCRALVTVRPLGTERFISILYGAACPKP